MSSTPSCKPECEPEALLVVLRTRGLSTSGNFRGCCKLILPKRTCQPTVVNAQMQLVGWMQLGRSIISVACQPCYQNLSTVAWGTHSLIITLMVRPVRGFSADFVSSVSIP